MSVNAKENLKLCSRFTPLLRELRSEITYVWSENFPTPRTFAKKLAEGKSFATTGPILFLEVANRKPGQTIIVPEGLDTTLNVTINLESHVYPVRYLELIVNVRVIERELFAQPKFSWELQHRLRVRKSCWFAARSYAEAGTDVHTNPIYIYVGDKLPFNRDSARHIISSLEGSIESILNGDVVARLKSLKTQLDDLLDGKKSATPFPRVQRK